MMSGSEIMSGTPRPVAGADAHAAPDLGRLVHSVINSTAAITFSANALRAPGHLTESSLEALARIEQSAKLVADAVKTFATALRDAPAPPSDGSTRDGISRQAAFPRALSEPRTRMSRRTWRRTPVTASVTRASRSRWASAVSTRSVTSPVISARFQRPRESPNA